MMNRNAARVSFGMLLAGIFAHSVLAEVAALPASGGGAAAGLIMMGSSSRDPYPFPWNTIRLEADPATIANAVGDEHGDGGAAPIFANDGVPRLVWARPNGAQSDLMISEWAEQGWSQPRPLLVDDGDALDPDACAVTETEWEVVWWTPEQDHETVRFASISTISDAPAQPTQLCPLADRCIRPGVSALFRNAIVGYERPSGGFVDLVVAREKPSGWEYDVLTSYALQPGDPTGTDREIEVHSRGAQLWIDWIEDDQTLAYREFDSAANYWKPVQFAAVTAVPGERAYDARARARATIRLCVLSGTMK